MGAMRRLLAPLTAALVLAGANAALADTPQTIKLSDEQSLTRWAHAGALSFIRAKPSAKSHRVGRLHYWTEDGYREIWLALASQEDAGGHEWVQVRVPGRPNGRTGWVPRESLTGFHTVRTQLVIDRRRLRATLYRNGKRVWRSPVGVGKRGTPTPGGHFYIREKIKALQGGTIYGPLAFGTSAYSNKLTDWPGGGVIGVHGTNQPQLIPGRPSHGCIRVPNRNILRLARLMPLGTPVHIL
jgi:L,D-transpeptidase catalytic domain